MVVVEFDAGSSISQSDPGQARAREKTVFHEHLKFPAGENLRGLVGHKSVATHFQVTQGGRASWKSWLESRPAGSERRLESNF